VIRRVEGRTLAVDASLAALLLTLGLLEIWAPMSSRDGSGSGVSASVGVVVGAVAISVRRVVPLVAQATVPVTWAVVGLVAPTYVLFWGTFVPIAVLLFSVARYGRGREPFIGAAVGAGSMLGADLTVSLLQSPGEYVFHWTVMSLVWTAGYGLRRYAERAHAATERAIRSEVEAAEQALQAVVDERTRIAREMHDIVGHALSAIVVQAGAAEQEAHDDPGATAHALAQIRTTGTAALQEMRRLVAILREDEESPLTPQPGVDGLPDLVGQACREGLRARLHREGDDRPLPAGMDLAVYRIVQEALTNVRRHSTATQVDVALRYGPDHLEVEVSDNGANGSPSATPAGHGLTGMRERVAMYDGVLEAGAGRHGFRVLATLPVTPAGT
jgi:signal transduction histidine kinase